MEQGNSDELIRLRIERWKEKLIDLSRRNRLIYFKTLKNTLFLESPPIKDVFGKFVLQERVFSFWDPTLPIDPSTIDLFEEVDANAKEFRDNQERPNPNPPKSTEFRTQIKSYRDLRRSLRSLYRRSQLDYRERGVRILHLALGMLRWVEADVSEDIVLSPIILCPTELSYDRVSDKFTVKLADDEEITVNPALQAKLQRDFNWTIPDLPDELFDSDSAYSLSDYFQQVKEQIVDSRWQVEQSILLGLFSFHKLVMHLDLDRHTDMICAHPLIRILAGENAPPDLMKPPPKEEELDEIEEPSDSYQVLDADSSQRRCIQMAIRGQSFVMHGPPGTGKSQTIANIIAECLARNKTILFVSEKMAALEVVHNRLKSVQLDEFCLELHSHKASKKEVAQNLARCLTERLQPRRLPAESDFLQLKSRREKLNRYVFALHQERKPLNRSVFQVFGELAQLQKISYIPFNWKNLSELTNEFLDRWGYQLRLLQPIWYIRHEQERFPWYGCIEKEYSLATVQAWDERLANAQQKLQDWISVANSYAVYIGLASCQTVADIRKLLNVAGILSQKQFSEPGWLKPNCAESALEMALKLSSKTNEYWASYRPIIERHGESFLNLEQGLAQKLKGVWDSCHYLFTESTVGMVYQRTEQLIDFLRCTREMLDICMPLVNGWQNQWQESIDDGLDIFRVTELAQLAVWCGTQEIRPESNWLDLSEWKQVNDLIAHIEPRFIEYNQRRGRLSKRYDESLFELTRDELDEWVDRFSKFTHDALLWRFHSKDRKFIRQISRTGTKTQSLYPDLLEASKLLQFYGNHIEPQREKLTLMLGSYHSGLSTDFREIRQSLERANQIMSIVRADSVPSALRQQLCLGTTVSRDLSIQGLEVSEKIKHWHDTMNRLSITPSKQGIPVVDNLPANELRKWISDLQPVLSDLFDILGKALDVSDESKNQTISLLIKDMQARDRASSICQEFDENMERFSKMFGTRYKALNTDWESLTAALRWSIHLTNLFSDRRIPEELSQHVCDSERTMEMENKLTESDTDLNNAIKELTRHFEPPYPLELRQYWPGQSVEDVRQYLEQWHNRREELRSWIDYSNIKQQFSDDNMGRFFNQLQKSIESSDELLPAFRKSILQSWTEYQINNDEHLKEFRTQNHELMTEEFREMDRRLIEMARQRVIQLCNGRRPVGEVSAADSEVGILRHEALKKGRHLPIRRLFDRIPNLLLRLKPCLMMSPISVAQFIDPNQHKFDIVIFDEASQIRPEDAIGSIYRGSQAIVAGDNKQLPPTDFFSLAMVDGDEDWDDVTMDDLDSILDEFVARVGSESELRWHYRSKRESLIAFSNYRFYDSKLITFPSTQVDDFGQGIEYIYVPDGIYDRGGKRNNRPEAVVAVDRIFDHFRKSPELSLGVVTFNTQQMDTIEDEVELRLRRHPEFARFFKREGLDGFFVKNLENVQGDERDVMLFSIGYGKDQQGRYSMNFGPLNRSGGERRLNVAITRAREKVVIVSSIRYSDMDIQRTKSEGVLNFYHYLRYAETGKDALPTITNISGGETESPFEDDVASEVRKMGYDVVPQVGCSGYRIDLGVVDPAQPGHFVLGVECDGAMYHSAKTARDRDRLRQEVLENMGWKIHRIWSPDWNNQREREVSRLKEVIEIARISIPIPAQTPEVDLPLEKEPVKNSPPLEYYKPLAIEQEYSRDLFYDESHNKYRKQLLNEIVNQEGPIHVDLAVRRLAQAYGIVKGGKLISQSGKRIITSCQRTGNIERQGNFLWAVDKNPSLPRTYDPKDIGSKRGITYIPPEELDAAMVLVIQRAVGIDKHSLYHETLKMFGFSRVTESARRYLDKALDRVQKSDICYIDGERILIR